MVHCLSLCYYLLYAFKYTDINFTIGKYKSEKLGFNRLKFRFFFKLLFQLCLCIGFSFLLHIAVMFGFEVCRAYIFGIVEVFAEEAEKVYIVAPKRCIFDFIAVSDADADGLPILVDVFPTAIYDTL